MRRNLQLKEKPLLFQTIREEIEYRESFFLIPEATLSSQTKGRKKQENSCPFRTDFQRDKDRILYSKAFRRLKHKTQVFFSPLGDHYRTRLTHTLEVSEISRTISRALKLNEDLTEAIALGHDLGHTPFGHAGETALNEIVPGGFSHARHSLRVVDSLENRGEGLNLTYEVRDGILKHSKGFGAIIPSEAGKWAQSPEGKIVRIADIIGYLNHDLDDAVRSKIITEEDIPEEFKEVLGKNHNSRISNMVRNVIENTYTENGKLIPNISESVMDTMIKLRAFLIENVYRHPKVHDEFKKSRKLIFDMFEYFMENKDDFLEYRNGMFEEDLHVIELENNYPHKVCDFIAGMTDRYAMSIYNKIFIPAPLF